MVRLVNSARQSAGLPGLAIRRALGAGARRHSASMGATGQLRHMSSKGRLTWAPPGVAAGENVGYGGNASTVFDMLMASPPHRANIMGRTWSAMGVGAVSACGSVWFALRFTG